MKPVSQEKSHCFKHACTHPAAEECPYCELALLRIAFARKDERSISQEESAKGIDLQGNRRTPLSPQAPKHAMPPGSKSAADRLVEGLEAAGERLSHGLPREADNTGASDRWQDPRDLAGGETDQPTKGIPTERELLNAAMELLDGSVRMRVFSFDPDGLPARMAKHIKARLLAPSATLPKDVHRALTAARGALVEVSPCASDDCKQIQRDAIDWAEKEIKAVMDKYAATDVSAERKT